MKLSDVMNEDELLKNLVIDGLMEELEVFAKENKVDATTVNFEVFPSLGLGIVAHYPKGNQEPLILGDKIISRHKGKVIVNQPNIDKNNHEHRH